MPTNKAQPTAKVRNTVFERDRWTCVACGSTFRLEFQHRQATGNGGTVFRPAVTSGLVACSECNMRFEADLLIKALRLGWKVRRWVVGAYRVPVWYHSDRSWFRLTDEGERVEISRDEAVSMMRDVYGDEWDQWREVA